MNSMLDRHIHIGVSGLPVKFLTVVGILGMAAAQVQAEGTSLTAEQQNAIAMLNYITHKTAAEIVFDSADHTKDNMGLSTWKHAPDGRILKSDVQIAKNYLDEKQISRLERAVSGYFDYIEDLIDRETVFTTKDFSESIKAFLSFRRYDILQGKGRVSHAQALGKANSEYDAFNKTQHIESDFDKQIRKMLNETND